jgi:light-regulated signal transduction histidine kinase (bacteriophytochrome)
MKADETERLVESISRGTRRMSGLVDDILNFSAVNLDPPQMEHVDLQQIVSDALQDLHASIMQSGAEISIDSKFPIIQGDRLKLLRLFINLISNALKFRRSDAPTEISISANKEDDHWVISVKDNGVGFENAEAKHVFGLFVRLKTVKDVSGSGMGLPMCRRIVEMHGGKIWADSSPGEGSVFSFTLPEVQAASLAASPNISRLDVS